MESNWISWDLTVNVQCKIYCIQAEYAFVYLRGKLCLKASSHITMRASSWSGFPRRACTACSTSNQRGCPLGCCAKTSLNLFRHSLGLPLRLDVEHAVLDFLALLAQINFGISGKIAGSKKWFIFFSQLNWPKHRQNRQPSWVSWTNQRLEIWIGPICKCF